MTTYHIPAALRCAHCGGRLLRDTYRELTCIACGRSPGATMAPPSSRPERRRCARCGESIIARRIEQRTVCRRCVSAAHPPSRGELPPLPVGKRLGDPDYEGLR